jgi:hypothetical protein
MIPRTHSNSASKPSETYLCYTRVRDPERCSQPPVKRGEIDGAVYAYFEKVGLDVEATRAQLSEAVDRRLAEVRALRGTVVVGLARSLTPGARIDLPQNRKTIDRGKAARWTAGPSWQGTTSGLFGRGSPHGRYRALENLPSPPQPPKFASITACWWMRART